jgi:hypothetical protein
LSPDLARVPTRSVEMVVDDVVDMRFAAHIRAPGGFTLDATSPDVRIEGGFGRFRSVVRQDEGGAVLVERNLELSPRRVDPTRYAAFAAFCRSVDQAQLGEIPFVRAAD